MRLTFAGAYAAVVFQFPFSRRLRRAAQRHVKPMHVDNTFIASAKFRYGFLAILLALLACDLWELPGQLHSGSAIPYRAVFLSFGLIFNHLAFFCLPHRAASRVARVFAVAWLCFVLVYGFTPLLR